MRAAAVDNFSNYDTLATCPAKAWVFLSAFFSRASVGFMVKLKFTGQTVNITIIRH